MTKLDQLDDLDDVTERLSDCFDDANPRAAVRARVGRQFADFRGATIRDFVPLFVERRVRAELHH